MAHGGHLRCRSETVSCLGVLPLVTPHHPLPQPPFLPYGATGHELLGTHYFSAKTRTRDRICDAMTAAKCMARVSLEVNVADIMLPPGYGFS